MGLGVGLKQGAEHARSLGFYPWRHYLGTVVHAGNTNTRELETGRSGVQSHSQLYIGFEVA